MATLMRTRPRSRSRRRGLLDLQNEVNRMFDTFFPRSEEGQDGGEERMPAAWSPRMDLTETDDAYHLQMDLPGMKKADINVRMDGNRLFVSGEREGKTTREGEDYVHSERYSGSFYRSLQLPATVEEKDIEANFKNGVLIIDLPKSEESKPKQIEIS